ncbi:MAG: DUF2254 domain-containing protein [Bacteroidales bacterium]
MKKILFFWNELKATFWFVPVLITLITIGLSVLFIYLDSLVTVSHEGIGKYIFISSHDSARSILTTIAGAMIGVAGTVFSITLVALTLASSQFGSRLIKNFMYDRINQVVLGSYISTYIYCLIVLNTIKANDQINFIPSFSILLALLAAAANILLLIIFFHHIATNIQADKVIADISTSLSKNIRTLFPETLEEEPDEKEPSSLEDIKAGYNFKQAVLAPKSGYLQYIYNDSLLQLLYETNGLIEFYYRPGDYLVERSPIGVLYYKEEIDEELLKKIQTKFILGNSRTQHQDAEHAIHQMVEIAARALSPGVNDPYTAITCVDNLTSTMSYLSNVKFPFKYRYDADGNLRVIADTLTYEGMLDAAFNQIRQFASGSPAVVIRIMEALITINTFAKRNSYKTAIKKHANMVLTMANDSFSESNDIHDLNERSKQILN